MRRDDETRFRDKVVVITGASSGIGAAAARRFGRMGATVAVVGRSPEKTAQVAAAVGGRAHVADFGRLDDVRRLAAELLAAYGQIDVLANNAGAIFSRRRMSVDGNELTFQVNHLAPFLLTNLLLDRLARAAAGARVINTASADYRRGHLDLDDLGHARGRYRSRQVYAASKLATVLFTRELADRTTGSAVTTAAFHPGVVATDVVRDNAVAHALMGTRPVTLFLATPDQGAEPLLHLATIADLAPAGGYFNRLEREELRDGQATDADLARRLWERSAELTGLTVHPERGEASAAPRD